MKDEQCDKCAYYEEMTGQPDIGACHYNPPTAITAITPNGPLAAGSAFPPTAGTGWCGRWKKGNLIKLSTKLPPEPTPFPGSIN